MNIRKLYIDAGARDLPLVAEIRRRLRAPAEIVADAHEVYRRLNRADDPVGQGKEVLFLTVNKGAFVRQCPGTRHYRCCGYRILHVGAFCSMDCSYCILQAYFHPPVLRFFVNIQDLFRELDHVLAAGAIARFGTGEFTDSLIWQPCLNLADLLTRPFAAQDAAVLELKTKTAAVEALKDLPHRRRTILGWSLNTEPVIRSEERRTASLNARLKAAACCESWGYPLGFHFDPLILYDGCENDYRAVIRRLFEHVSADNIVWISLGGFRFMPSLKPIIEHRFPDSRIVHGELISGPDGKMRYFKPLRLRLYREIIRRIREQAPDVTIYFCMEDDDVWENALGFTPDEKGGLARILDDSAVRVCGLAPHGRRSNEG